mmetsp:Transcript_12419/g.34862  ORF Transcript_12419/g.34862 Transcript_12419/m.34862 type:complete len:304 (-) Transcript_12419:491-1402(-)
MLDLVVEPPLHEVHGVGEERAGLGIVAAHMEVGGADDGAQVKLVALHLHGGLKLVNVVTGMVGGNDAEAVEVCEELGKDDGDEGSLGGGGPKEGIHSARDNGKHHEAVGEQALGQVHSRAELPACQLLHRGDDGGRVLPNVAPVLCRGLLSTVQGLVGLPPLELLQGVWGVVVPLPHKEEGHHLCKAEGHWYPLALLEADGVLQVALHKVWVTTLAQLVVVEVVVLHIPRLRFHPVQPVYHALPQAKGKRPAVEAAGDDPVLRLLGVVPAVAHMVANHCPAGHDGNRHGDAAEQSEGAQGQPG